MDDDNFPIPKTAAKERSSLPLSQEGACFGPSSSSQEFPGSQTQTSEILTQNPDLTQLGEFEEDLELSPLPPYSPAAQLKLPWGRLMPAKGGAGIDLLPRCPSEQSFTSTTTRQQTGRGVSLLGLEHILPSDIFNEYILGRSAKCDVLPNKPLTTTTKKEKAMHEWAYGMISNKHCRIYCSLDQRNSGMDVYIEDSSGNGTLVNKTTLLRRGEKRLLHSGDEICLVNPQTLRKKIRSNGVLQELLQHHSFIFVNIAQQQVGSFASITNRTRLSTSMAKRKPAVDVRAVKQHSQKQPPATAATAKSQSSPSALLSQDSNASRRRSTGSRRISPRRQPARRIEEEYDIRDLLGSGTVGEVRRAIHRQTGAARAVKIITLGGRNRANHIFMESNATFEAEAAILQNLEHPYIVNLIDVFVAPTAVYLVMELLHGGDLFDRIVEKGNYTEVESRRTMRRLLSAVYYLHEERNIVHRDIKPENILLMNRESDVHVKLTDFGLAKAVNGEEGLKTFCGTPQYFAPEVLKRRHTVAGRGRYGKQADMWSIGVVLYILLSGTPPFDVNMGIDVVANAQIQFPEEYWGGISEQAKDLVRALLVDDPRKRITVRDACKHEWIMIDDGDTHVHPLDDPKLALSKKRLFSLDASSGDDQGKPEDQDGAATDEHSDTKSETQLATAEAQAKETDASTLEEASDVQPPDEKTRDGFEDASTSEARAEISMDVIEPGKSNDHSQAEISSKAKVSLDGAEAGGRESKAGDFSESAAMSAAAVAESTGAAARAPLSPVSLNETSTGDQGVSSECDKPVSAAAPCMRLSESAGAQVDEDAKADDKEKGSTDDKDSVDDLVAATAVTPSTSNRAWLGQGLKQLAPPFETEQKVELSDDEISQFSEQTESISSFSACTQEVEAAKESNGGPRGSSTGGCSLASAVGTSSKQSLEKPHVELSGGRSRKRRVTDSVDSLATIQPNKKARKRVATTRQQKPKSKAKTKRTPQVDQRKSTDAKLAQVGKQTTLSSWFKKSK